MDEPKLSSCAIVFVTPDIHQATRYYRDILGFRIVDHYNGEEKFAAMYRDTVENVMVQAQHGTVKSNVEKYGAGYDAYLVPTTLEAVESFYLEIQAKGAKFYKPSSRARRAAWVRSWTPSFWKITEM